MRKSSILIVLVSALLFSSCVFCDENAPTGCKECYKRLAGDWTLNYLATNGVDSVNYFDSIYGDKCVFNFEFYDKHTDYGTGPSIGFQWGDTLPNPVYENHGFYYGLDGNSNLDLVLALPPTTNSKDPFTNWVYSTGELLWKINRLSETELWFELDMNGNKYEMHLNK